MRRRIKWTKDYWGQSQITAAIQTHVHCKWESKLIHIQLSIVSLSLLHEEGHNSTVKDFHSKLTLQTNFSLRHFKMVLCQQATVNSVLIALNPLSICLSLFFSTCSWSHANFTCECRVYNWLSESKIRICLHPKLAMSTVSVTRQCP